jgi:Leucine-rich repeat (LRR) protein
MKFIILISSFLMATSAFADVCKRSPTVAKWLEKKVGYSCALIAEEDLAQFKELNWSGLIKELFPGDLDGFVNLETLNLSYNYGLDLPPNIFKDLRNLKTLYLIDDSINSFKPDTFVGLKSIEFLWLDKNEFTKIEPWYFAHLNHLRSLSFAQNRVAEIRPGAFRDLSGLEVLYFEFPNFSRLSKDIVGNIG